MSVYKLPDGTFYDDASGKIIREQKSVPEEKPSPSSIDWGRMGAEALGGVVGGTAGLPAGPMGILAGVGLGSEAGGQILDISRQYMGGKPIQGGLLNRATKAAESVAMNALGEGIGGEVMNAIGRGASTLMAPVKRRIFGQQTAKGLLNTFNEAGIPPSVGMVSGNRLLQGLEEGMTKTPGSSGVMDDYMTRFYDAMKLYHKKVASTGGMVPNNEEMASAAIRQASKASAERFSKRYKELENTAESIIGKYTRVTPSNSAELLSQMESEVARDPSIAVYMSKPINQLKSIVRQGLADDAPANAVGDISFDALRAQRTHIGKSLENPSVSGYVGREPAQFNRIYGALSEDAKQAAIDKGPEAFNAWMKANRYARMNLNTRIPYLQKVEDNALKAYQIVMSGSKYTGENLRVMRNNLTPDEWDNIVSSTVERMGLAKSGNQNIPGDVFSPQVWMTNWNNLSEGAKMQLFGGKRYAALRKEMNNLNEITQSVKNMQYVKNYSGTAQQNMFIDMLTNPIKATAALATFGIPQRYAAKAFTNPKFVSWIAKGAKIPATNYNAIQAHMARMPLVAGMREITSQEE